MLPPKIIKPYQPVLVVKYIDRDPYITRLRWYQQRKNIKK